MNKYGLLIFLLIVFSFNASAQDKPDMIFNQVLEADFSIAKLKVDTSLGAVIIADIGSSSFEANARGGINLIYKRQRRIKIINKKGYSLASITISIAVSPNSDNKEELHNLKASTYNLIHGTVVETKLDSATVFIEKENKHHLLNKFTMPAVKDGAIIEYSYIIKSDFLYYVQPWLFQYDYPCVWSEYQVNIPSYYEYVYLLHGNNHFDIKTATSKLVPKAIKSISAGATLKTLADSLSFESTANRWVSKNIPAFKAEIFTSALTNYIPWIEFQRSGFQFRNLYHADQIGTWKDLSKRLINDEDFGQDLDKLNIFLNASVRQINNDSVNHLNQAKNAYAYLKNNIKSKGYGNVYISTSLKEVFKTKSGYAQDINLLLVALLRRLNIEANPVILSTRGNGIADINYPLLRKFNYVICQANIDEVNYYLDASEPYLGFNKLPSFCYNGAGRVITTAAPPVYFTADSVKENGLTSVMLFNDEKITGKWTGDVKIIFTNAASNNFREQFLEAAGRGNVEKKLKEHYTSEYAITDIKYEDDSTAELPLKLSFALSITTPLKTDIIYFNPMLKSGYTTNIFTAADRKYPVEMPAQKDETYILHLEIPEGYVVDEIPKSAKVSLNKDDGFFEYLIDKDEKEINLRSRIKLNKANFLPEEYVSLRSFFDFVVKKHAEQIVFKKK